MTQSLIDQIKTLPPIDILKQILSFYECPKPCQALCCKELDIPIDAVSRKRIASMNKKHKKVMNTLISCNEEISFNGRTLKGDRILPVKPCPFLNVSRCSIYLERPESCRMFPFFRGFSTDQNEPDYPFKYELANCEFGFQISLDYAVFILYYGKQSEIDVEESFKKEEEFLLKQMALDMTKKENLTVIKFAQFDILRAFYGFLLDFSKDERELYREKLRMTLIDKKEMIKCG